MKSRIEVKKRVSTASDVARILKKLMFNANYLMIRSFRLHWLLVLGLLIIEYLQLTYYALHDVNIDGLALDWFSP